MLKLGYSRKFLRMFEFYFAYCEAGFAHKLIYDLQMTWVGLCRLLASKPVLKAPSVSALEAIK